MSFLNFEVGLFPTEPVPRMIELGSQAEKLGFTHVWVGDSHLIWREAYVNMAALALSTSRLKIGTGVTNPLTRHPSVLASAFATLDEMSPGRFSVGIGLGDSSVETMGLQPTRLADFEQAVEQMRALITGQEAVLDSGNIHLNFPREHQIPFYIAASGPRMLELAGRIADGVIILVGVAQHRVQKAIEKIHAGAESAGRKLADIDLVLWVPCAVSEQEPARNAVKAHVARIVTHPLPFTLDENEQQVLDEIRKTYDYYQHMKPTASQAEVIPDWLIDKFAIAGTPEECRAKVLALQKTGINQVAIVPYNVGDADRGGTLEQFAAVAMPD